MLALRWLVVFSVLVLASCCFVCLSGYLYARLYVCLCAAVSDAEGPFVGCFGFLFCYNVLGALWIMTVLWCDVLVFSGCCAWCLILLLLRCVAEVGGLGRGVESSLSVCACWLGSSMCVCYIWLRVCLWAVVCEVGLVDYLVLVSSVSGLRHCAVSICVCCGGCVCGVVSCSGCSSAVLWDCACGVFLLVMGSCAAWMGAGCWLCGSMCWGCVLWLIVPGSAFYGLGFFWNDFEVISGGVGVSRCHVRLCCLAVLCFSWSWGLCGSVLLESYVGHGSGGAGLVFSTDGIDVRSEDKIVFECKNVGCHVLSVCGLAVARLSLVVRWLPGGLGCGLGLCWRFFLGGSKGKGVWWIGLLAVSDCVPCFLGLDVCSAVVLCVWCGGVGLASFDLLLLLGDLCLCGLLWDCGILLRGLLWWGLDCSGGGILVCWLRMPCWLSCRLLWMWLCRLLVCLVLPGFVAVVECVRLDGALNLLECLAVYGYCGNMCWLYYGLWSVCGLSSGWPRMCAAGWDLLDVGVGCSDLLSAVVGSVVPVVGWIAFFCVVVGGLGVTVNYVGGLVVASAGLLLVLGWPYLVWVGLWSGGIVCSAVSWGTSCCEAAGMDWLDSMLADVWCSPCWLLIYVVGRGFAYCESGLCRPSVNCFCVWSLGNVACGACALSEVGGAGGWVCEWVDVCGHEVVLLGLLVLEPAGSPSSSCVLAVAVVLGVETMLLLGVCAVGSDCVVNDY
ncbi:hypothetical protein Tco_1227159 [Tanacetum coccineum]